MTVSPNAQFTFTDDLFDPECPPSITPSDNTGIFLCSSQTEKEPLFPPRGVTREVAVSEIQNSPPEVVHCQQSSLASTVQTDSIISALPTPPSTPHLAEEPSVSTVHNLPVRRKRAASVQGKSAAKRYQSLPQVTMIEEICQLLAERTSDEVTNIQMYGCTHVFACMQAHIYTTHACTPTHSHTTHARAHVHAQVFPVHECMSFLDQFPGSQCFSLMILSVSVNHL